MQRPIHKTADSWFGLLCFWDNDLALSWFKYPKCQCVSVAWADVGACQWEWHPRNWYPNQLMDHIITNQCYHITSRCQVMRRGTALSFVHKCHEGLCQTILLPDISRVFWYYTSKWSNITGAKFKTSLLSEYAYQFVKDCPYKHTHSIVWMYCIMRMHSYVCVCVCVCVFVISVYKMNGKCEAMTCMWSRNVSWKCVCFHVCVCVCVPL